ncbi:MAG: valine--tRNA ligase [Clostridiales bacterium]|nr:valine--tRNA ligase [Clostridiales bacterium]
MAEMNKIYDPKQAEGRIYKKWMDMGAFTAHIDENKKPCTMVIPPPNITGKLHMGHALDNTLQDILARYKRMSGYSMLWLPGTDHASIATEVKIVEMLAKEGVTKYDLGRDGFLKRAWEWKEEYGSTITEQLKKIGSSLDWSRERFTMDEGCNRAVNRVFVNLYNKGLIYRGKRIINWCCECQTALSDAEVEYEEEEGSLWHIKYPVKGEEGRYVTVATTRPETMLGDTAVAVNPADERYASIVGKTVILPLINKEIPVIADDYVDVEFGTGVVKITPAHDPNDFEVGRRHNLPVIAVIGEDGIMTDDAAEYKGLDRYEARKRMVADLEKLGLLEKIEKHVHNVGHCYRCHTTVEPMVSTQWFVKMKPLAEPAIEAVRNGEVEFIPERFDKIYYNWMENIRDWCISRQLWWGHRIPAWYCEKCGEVHVAESAPECCSKCGGKLKQDEDVLDTWFSSALWPFSTLGWPEETEDMKYFYPTFSLITGYDIIFFWVARMIFSAIEHTGQVPFKHVLIHGLVRDEQGRKMSKSLGNGVDPLEIVDEYGADALRMSLVAGITPGNDMRYSDKKVRAYRDFANKIWNAGRFIMMNLDTLTQNGVELKKPEESDLSLCDKWIRSRLNTVINEVTQNMDNFDFGIASLKIYDFIWSEFCDWYIELTKVRLYGDDVKAKSVAIYMLIDIFSQTMKLLHPFMPFITEEIWCALPHEGETVMLSDWPKYNPDLEDTKAIDAIGVSMDIIRAVRNLRSELDVKNSQKIQITVSSGVASLTEDVKNGAEYIMKLANADSIDYITPDMPVPENAKSLPVGSLVLYIPMGSLIDVNAELARLTKQLDTLKSEVERAQGKLNNEAFVAKAPPALVEKEKEKMAKSQQALDTVLAEIENLKKMM